MRKIILFIVLYLVLLGNSFAQVAKYLRKASHATENGYLEKSRQYYLKALSLEKDNYDANIGLGITLSEFMDQLEEALPYLEKAYKHSPKDTLPDLYYALAKCYQHAGKFTEAIHFLDKLSGSVAIAEDNKGYQLDLIKRKSDCEYALANSVHTHPSEWYVINVGSVINTAAPEYVPVLTPENELLFTSKRKDHKKEKINDLDGKYFESMYISKLEKGRFTSPRRYTIPDLIQSPKFRKHHESIVSMSPDGKKLFVYREGQIYEVDLTAIKQESPKKLSKNINFDRYQNHAYLNNEGNILYFTSEAEGGFGGLDIYKSVKGSDGTWGKAENLGPTINTPYDEDAPFVSQDGKTLYFASRGLPGYGNFDLYKSDLIDGKWALPENLGYPINSQAHDIFMVQNKDGNIGYFSSSRPGGKGDMDIYKINYLKDFNRECVASTNELISIKSELINIENRHYAFTITLPEYLKTLKFNWSIEGESLNKPMENYTEHTFSKAGEHQLKVKVFAYCDTCFEPLVLCQTKLISIEGKEPVVTPTVTSTTPSVAVASTSVNTSKPTKVKLAKGQLTNEQLESLGFDLTVIKFDFDSDVIRENSKSTLKKNALVLISQPKLRLEINGYSDSKGDPAYNIDISERRARAVKKFLLQQGVKDYQITKIIGNGNSKLLNNCIHPADCTDEENEINRRVEFTVSKH